MLTEDNLLYFFIILYIDVTRPGLLYMTVSLEL